MICLASLTQPPCKWCKPAAAACSTAIVSVLHELYSLCCKYGWSISAIHDECHKKRCTHSQASSCGWIGWHAAARTCANDQASLLADCWIIAAWWWDAWAFWTCRRHHVSSAEPGEDQHLDAQSWWWCQWREWSRFLCHLWALLMLTNETSCPTLTKNCCRTSLSCSCTCAILGVLFSHLCSIRSFGKMTLSPENDWKEVTFHTSSWESLENFTIAQKAPLASGSQGTMFIFYLIIFRGAFFT